MHKETDDSILMEGIYYTNIDGKITDLYHLKYNPDNPDSSDTKNKKINNTILIVIGVIAIIVLIYFIYKLIGSKSNNKNSGESNNRVSVSSGKKHVSPF